jgi:hypothetical protein
MEQDKPTIYSIPQNYTNADKVLGVFELRKLLEMIVIMLLTIPFLVTSKMSLQIKIVVTFLVGGAELVIVGFGMGLGGDSLTQYLFNVFNYLRNKRKLKFRRIRHGSKAISHKQHEEAVIQTLESVAKPNKKSGKSKPKAKVR